jgi:hypothetical protein
MLNLSELFKKAEGKVQIYGSPLYTLVDVVGVITPNQFVFNKDNNTIAIENEGCTMYIPVRRATIDAGFDGSSDVTIGNYVATRDESGEYNGTEWTVSKGTMKWFAE